MRRWFRWSAHWPVWSGYAAAGGSALYGALGVFWVMGGGGFPFAPVEDDRASGSILEGSEAGAVAPVMAVVGLIGTVAALTMTRQWGRNGVRKALIGFGWGLAGLLVLIIPDFSLLALIAFSPLLLVFAFTGVPGPQEGIGDILYWHRTNLIILFVIGVLWALTTLAYQRRTSTRQVCAHCGRGEATIARWTTPEAARRWGRWAVYVACAAPVPYEITRIAWYAGLPLGITDDFLRMMRETPGMLEVGLGCALASIGGAVLTQGLIRPWGEVYPRWIWFRTGRRVPPALAVVPATLVALAAIPAGFMNLRMSFDAGLGESWGLNAPGVLWIFWGAGLGLAAYAYALRRRGSCRHCRTPARVRQGRRPFTISA